MVLQQGKEKDQKTQAAMLGRRNRRLLLKQAGKEVFWKMELGYFHVVVSRRKRGGTYQNIEGEAEGRV